MGNGFCYRPDKEDQPMIIVEYKDLSGQYNNYKSYGKFDLMVGKKIRKDEGFELEGSYVEDNLKCKFTGKINKGSVEFNAEVCELYIKKFTGQFDKDLQRYVGSVNMVGNIKNLEGKFWMKILEKTFWLDTYKTPQTGINTQA
jgi:hypothetical protein